MISKQKDDDGAKKEVFIHATVYRQIYDEKKKDICNSQCNEVLKQPSCWTCGRKKSSLVLR